jgi:hypothetical protein
MAIFDRVIWIVLDSARRAAGQEDGQRMAR